MVISIFRTLLYHTTLKQDSEGQSVVMEAPAVKADIIPGIDEERETHPTREDVRDLLETKYSSSISLLMLTKVIR